MTADEELLRDAGEAALVVDQELRCQAVTDAALALVGYRREELVGASAVPLVAFGPAWVAQEVAALLEHGHWRGDVALRRKDGGVRHVHAEAALVPGPRGMRIRVRLLPH